MEKNQNKTEEKIIAEALATEAEAVTEENEAVPVGAEEAKTGVRAAWNRFFSSLSEGDRVTLLAVLDRLCAGERQRLEHEAHAAENAAIAEMDKDPAFAGIAERADALRTLISKIGWLRSLPMRDRLAAALYLDRGMHMREPTPAEKIEAVLADPALLRALAERQAMAEREAEALRPPTVRAAHSGRMPARLPKEPENLTEAGEAAKHYFKIRK